MLMPTEEMNRRMQRLGVQLREQMNKVPVDIVAMCVMVVPHPHRPFHSPVSDGAAREEADPLGRVSSAHVPKLLRCQGVCGLSHAHQRYQARLSMVHGPGHISTYLYHHISIICYEPFCSCFVKKDSLLIDCKAGPVPRLWRLAADCCMHQSFAALSTSQCLLTRRCDHSV